jgi:hypothetical protein
MRRQRCRPVDPVPLPAVHGADVTTAIARKRHQHTGLTPG